MAGYYDEFKNWRIPVIYVNQICPTWLEGEDVDLCPSCGSILDNKMIDPDVLKYCGPGCRNCGWQHCGECI